MSGSHRLADTFRIMIASDSHLGYLESDPIRGNDSFQAFEEMLELAVKNRVDMILLGGDLFHHNKPSRDCMYKTMGALRKHCTGDAPIQIMCTSEAGLALRAGNDQLNFMDPNVNISLPVFSIHGNHDDPSGKDLLSAVDLLAQARLLNHFGHQQDLSAIKLFPLLLQKGVTRVALYGLGNIRDERLYRSFQQEKVQFMMAAPPRSPEDDDAKIEYFNVLVLHQNRYAHTQKNYLPTQALDTMLDFVLWGHEHECKIEPDTSGGDFCICQPGSSVATSLSEGEAVEKKVAILEIHQNQFRLTPIPLRTVRPFYFKQISLLSLASNEAEEEALKDEKGVQIALSKYVNEILHDHEHSDKANDKMPLIRVRIDYTACASIAPARFGQEFVGKVANPDSMVLFFRAKKSQAKTRRSNEEGEDVKQAFFPERPDPNQLEALIDDFIKDAKKGEYEILSENGLNRALHQFVEKDEKNSFQNFVSHSMKKKINQLIKNANDFSSVDACKEKIIDITKEERKKERIEGTNQELEAEELREMEDSEDDAKIQAKIDKEELSMSSSEEEAYQPLAKRRASPSKAKASRGKSKASPVVSKRRPRRTSVVEIADDSDDDDDEEEERRRNRSAKAAVIKSEAGQKKRRLPASMLKRR